MTNSGSGDALDRVAVPQLRLTPAVLVAIALGGALGTVARFLLDTTFSDSAVHFPTTTLLINLSGSLAIGLLVPLVDNFSARAPLVRPFLIVGILGGWTTYSTLAVDAVVLAKDGHVAAGVFSVVATVVGGLALVLVGHALGRRALGQAPVRRALGQAPGHWSGRPGQDDKDGKDDETVGH
jgi:CrcB protein